VTLRLRLGVAATLLIVVLGAVGLLVLHSAEKSALDQTDDQLLGAVPTAFSLARNQLGVPAFRHRPPGQGATANGDAALTEIYVATISDGKRHVLAAPDTARHDVPKTPPGQPGFGPGGAHPVTVGSAHGSDRWRAILIEAGPTHDQLLVAVSMAHVDATSSDLRDTMLVAAAIVALVLAASGYWIVRLGLRPIAEVHDVAEAIVAGDRTRRLPPAPGRSEATQLARAFNLMLDNQEEVERRLRQFVADASHELRTPTAAVSGLAQLWRQGGLRDGEALGEAMRRIGQESVRMGALVEELLLLAHLDEGSPVHRETVDLAALARETLDAVANGPYPPRHATAATPGPVLTEGDPAALRRVISNLVTNAFVHTAPTSDVEVRAYARPASREVAVEVIDAGPGMTGEDAAHAFDRFWRATASRSRPGSGLGLSIVAGIVSAHGGHTSIDTSPEGGTTVRVVLPGLLAGQAGGQLG
jgi:two-component system, OmpR family, sensor kinase